MIFCQIFGHSILLPIIGWRKKPTCMKNFQMHVRKIKIRRHQSLVISRSTVTPVPGSDNNTDGKYGRAYCQYVPIDKDSISTIKCFQKNFDLESGTYSYVDWDNHIPNVVVHQPRKRKPGWDGCRDRNDGKYTVDNIPVGGDGIDDVTNFKNQLLYERPFGMSGYGMQYHEKYRALYTFAGAGYDI